MIIDNHKEANPTYKDIVQRIAGDDYYYRIWRYNSFEEYVYNLLKALVNSRDIVLIDRDFSDSELNDLGFNKKFEDKVELLNSVDPSDVDEMISLIKNSHSRISIFTSGTTGTPKEVVHTVKSLTRMTRMSERYGNNIWGLAYNPTHMAGLQVLFQAVFNQNKIINLFGKLPSKIAHYIQKLEITHISATPTFYRLLLAESRTFEKVERVTLGGERSDERVIKMLQRAFPNAKINNIYASTEIGSLFVADGEIFKVPEELHGKIKIRDNELYINSELLPDKSLVNDKWYATGDLVEKISDSPLSFRFASRKSEMVNVGGYLVSLPEIEASIRKLNDVVDARVFGKKNSVIGNLLCADIQLKEESSLSKKDIRNQLNQLLQEYKVPQMIKLVEKIETTRTGKTSRV